MSTAENQALIGRMMDEVMNQGNVGLIDELYPPDAVAHIPGAPVILGREGTRHLLLTYRTAFPDVHITAEDVFAADDRVVQRYTFAGTHTGDLQGIAPTGKAVSVPGMVIARIAGARWQSRGSFGTRWGCCSKSGRCLCLRSPPPEAVPPQRRPNSGPRRRLGGPLVCPGLAGWQPSDPATGARGTLTTLTERRGPLTPHFDHSGQNALLGSVPVYAQAAEYAATRDPRYTVREWMDFPGRSTGCWTARRKSCPGCGCCPPPGLGPAADRAAAADRVFQPRRCNLARPGLASCAPAHSRGHGAREVPTRLERCQWPQCARRCLATH